MVRGEWSAVAPGRAPGRAKNAPASAGPPSRGLGDRCPAGATCPRRPTACRRLSLRSARPPRTLQEVWVDPVLVGDQAVLTVRPGSASVPGLCAYRSLGPGVEGLDAARARDHRHAGGAPPRPRAPRGGMAAVEGQRAFAAPHLPLHLHPEARRRRRASSVRDRGHLEAPLPNVGIAALVP